ncbi:hypothetical protein A7Q09_05495 [Methylacidiphilum sp. Yel]|nr:hypothetical protein A7Q09_05495 [Methylacidiphilum sp. Yel]
MTFRDGRISIGPFVVALTVLLGATLKRVKGSSPINRFSRQAGQALFSHLRDPSPLAHRPKTFEADIGGAKHRGVTAGKRAGRQIFSALQNQFLGALETEKKNLQNPLDRDTLKKGPLIINNLRNFHQTWVNAFQKDPPIFGQTLCPVRQDRERLGSPLHQPSAVPSGSFSQLRRRSGLPEGSGFPLLLPPPSV